MPTVPRVNATGGGINPQLDVLAQRALNRGSGSTYNPEVTAEQAMALGIPTAERRQAIEQKRRATDKIVRESDLANALAATQHLPAGTRATVQMRVLSDPAAWSESAWP